jgi:hypothetical protein
MNHVHVQQQFGPKSKALISTIVGVVEITEPFKYRQNCEVAAWYTDYESDVGEFQLELRSSHLERHNLHVAACVPATVVDNYHAPLFGGVPIGPSKSSKGERGTVPITYPWERTVGRSYDKSGMKFHINRKHWDAVVEYCELRLRYYIDEFPYWRDEYFATPRSQFNKEIGMVGHFGQGMADWSDRLEETLREIGYQDEYDKRTGEGFRWNLMKKFPGLDAERADAEVAKFIGSLRGRPVFYDSKQFEAYLDGVTA